MPKELNPYLANAIGIIVTDKPGDSPYKVVSQKVFSAEVNEFNSSVEKINENAEYIRRNTENIGRLRETIEAVRNIKADVRIVEENAARISSNLEAIETNASNIASMNESLSSVESSISNLESSISSLSAKDDELDMGIQSNLALIESYAENGGEIDQHINNKIVDYVSKSFYTTDQSNKSATYSNLYQTKTAAAEDKTTTDERLASLDTSISEINGNLSSINSSLSTKAEQSSVDANTESISTLSAKSESLEEKISENSEAISSSNSIIQSNSTQISNILADVANINTSLSQKSNLSYVDEQISNTQNIISGHVSDGGLVDQKISAALESYVSSDSYSSDQQSRELAYDAKYASISSLSNLQTTVSSNSARINNNTASIANATSTISSIREDVEELKTIKADVEAVNENAEYIRQNAENLETLQETVENIQSIKADVETVQENAQRIASNLEAIETNTSNIASVQERMTAAESAIEENSSSIAEASGQISSLSSSVGENTSAITEANGKISTIEENITAIQSDVSGHTASIAAVSEMAAENETAISTLNTQIASNAESISLTQDRVSTLENAGYLTKNSFSQGLYRLQGDTSTTSAKHTIVTKKNGKNITSMIWNESSGGGSMFTNEDAGKKSFIGVNNGDGDNEIWLQGYAKNISSNIGTRITLSTEGFYYTKNQANGSYNAGNEVVTQSELAPVGAKVNSAYDYFLERIAGLEMKIADLSRTNIDNVQSTDQINYSDPAADVVISADIPVTQISAITAKTIDVESLNVDSAKITFVSDGKIKLNDVSFTGAYSTGSGTQVTITPNDYVEIRDCNFGAGGYNAVEIGLNVNSAPKSVIIDNCTFSGNLKNNAISIFAQQNDAIIKISNCVFADVSNVLRISNRTNTKATFIFENCTFTRWESYPAYSGAVVCQDYTSQSVEETESNNLFAPEKIRIKFINCVGPSGDKISGSSDPTIYSGSGNENQLLYVYADNGGGIVSYNSARYPEVEFV